MSNMAEMLDKHNINACAILVGVDPAQNKRNCHRESGFKLTGANVFFIIHLERLKVQEQPTLFGSFYLFQTWTWEAFLHLTELSNIKTTFLKTIKLSSEVEKWERLLHKGWEGGQRERKERDGGWLKILLQIKHIKGSNDFFITSDLFILLSLSVSLS